MYINLNNKYLCKVLLIFPQRSFTMYITIYAPEFNFWMLKNVFRNVSKINEFLLLKRKNVGTAEIVAKIIQSEQIGYNNRLIFYINYIIYI